MKKHFLLLLVAVLAMNIAVVAQGPQGQQRQGERPQFSAKDRAEQMAKDLKLTDTQKQKVQALFEGQQVKMKELRASGTTDQDARREELKTLRTGWDKELEGIIGKENMVKYKTMTEERFQKAREKRSEQK